MDLKAFRSLHYNYPVNVHFINKTERFVDIIWIDYEGKWIRYKILPPGDLFEIDTFQTYPWVFLDDKTKCRLIAVGKGEVFCACAVDEEKEKRDVPLEISITIPLLSLRERCLEVLCHLAVNRDTFSQLNLCKRMVQQLEEFCDVPLEFNHILDLASVVATCEIAPQSEEIEN